VRELLVESDRPLTRVRHQDRGVFIERFTAEEGPEPYGAAIISGTPRASMPTPMTKTPPIGPKAVKPYSQM
jgi:hypothetical protein